MCPLQYTDTSDKSNNILLLCVYIFPNSKLMCLQKSEKIFLQDLITERCEMVAKHIKYLTKMLWRGGKNPTKKLNNN